MTFSNHNYKIIEAKEDYKDSVIEKDNIKSTFSIREFENNIEYMSKTIKEITAKFNHEKIVKENIEEHHPFVKDLTPEQLHTVYMYVQAKEVVDQYEPRIKEFEDARATEISELAHVMKVLDIKTDGE